MPIDYEAIARAGGFGKGRPKSLLVEDVKKKRVSVDDRESEKVRKRSGGICEVHEPLTSRNVKTLGRCTRRAVHVHHMLGGNGVRGRGESAKSIRKQHVCDRCHEDIGGKKLVRIGGELPHYTDRYRRVK
jgi:hypothetical protein